ncbi:hypothetical protein F2P56_034098 [Juglans regia]|uniref:Reverse transcriptase Ty1/copia-type domain-containing protein n=1 Tax=Juglans regia TaxID=51240 RepID=A0A833WTY9_JUGRE|nr:hypothetical protein F2P56_034098 [Juglans regia]
MGFTCSHADSSLFVLSRGADLIYLLLYVDDIVVTSNNSSLLDGFIGKLTREFATKDLRSLNYFLGLEAHRTFAGLFLNRVKYAHEILQHAQLLDSKLVSTPMVVAYHLSATGSDFGDPSLYRSLVGVLQYLIITRLDIAHAVTTVIFTSSSSREILAYSNADWARCPDTRRSISDFAIYFGDKIMSWSSKKQLAVSRSSYESEYRALALTDAKVKWLCHLLCDLHVLSVSSPIMLCDNQSSIFFAIHPVSHKHSKHIGLDYHFARELVASGELHIRYVPTNLQVAYVFTKSLGKPAFIFLQSKLRVKDS